MEEQLIRRLRALMLIHSHLYYRMCTSIVNDFQYDWWAKELASLPYKEIGFYDEVFKDWDGSTGYHLPYDDWIHDKACYILELHDRVK